MLSGLAGIQAPIIMMRQNRAAARDEILAAHHYNETHKIDQLLAANTDLQTTLRQAILASGPVRPGRRVTADAE